MKLETELWTVGLLKNYTKRKISFIFKRKTRHSFYNADFFNSPTVTYFYIVVISVMA